MTHDNHNRAAKTFAQLLAIAGEQTARRRSSEGVGYDESTGA